MASIPLPALQVRPPEQPANPMDQYAKAVQLKSMLQAQQLQGQQVQQGQMALDDQKKVRQAFMDNNGDIDATIKQAAKTGVSPQMLTQLQQHSIDIKTKMAALTKDQLGNFAAVHDNAAGLIQPVLDAKTPEEKDAAYQAGLKAVAQNPQMYGVSDPSQVPAVRPPDDALKTQLALHMGQKEQAAQTMKERTVAAEEMAAKARMMTAQASEGKSGPLAPPVVAQAQQAFDARFQVNNPGQPTPDWAKLPPNATKTDADRIDKQLEQVEKAQGTKSTQDLARATAANARNTGRSDKSYQFNSGQLEKVAAPVDQAIARISKLQDSLAQNNPQADSLIAPELLSVMAGGSGSGLRMNEAEISRVLGGRTQWETLQASLNKWSTDPTHAQIPPAQRKQISDLVTAVDSKLKTKQAALEDARQALINTDDPGEHRNIVAKARAKMTAVDQGSGGGTASGMVRFKDSQGGVHDIPAANLDKAKQRDPGLQVIQQ